MNPVSLAMDGLLAVLLMTAVGVGVRLNGKLKLLRDGLGQFVRAVGDLDVAAARAEAGLSALRSATEETHDALLTRIETARALLPRLDRACEDAATAAARLDEGVRAADAAGRRAHTAAEAAEAAFCRAAPEPVERGEAAGAGLRRAPPVSAEPIPFPTIRRDTPARSLAEALAAAGRIVEAEAPAPPSLRQTASASRTVVSAAPPAAGRLASFVARRRGARA